MITFKNVSYKIKNKLVLSNITFHIKKQEKVLISGQSGCGKSTLFNLLLRNIYPTSGIIYYEKKDLNQFSTSKLNEYRKNHISVITQQDDLLDSLSVLKNLTLFYFEKDVIQILKTAKLYSLKDRLVSTLSGGERQRIAIIKACLDPCEVLLCDEITSALDKKNAIEIIDFVLYLFSSKTILFISHDRSLFEGKINRLISIENHKIIQDDVFSELQNTNIHFTEKKRKNFYANAIFFGFKKFSFSLLIVNILTVLCFYISLSFQDIFHYFAKKSYQKYFDYNVVSVKDNQNIECDYYQIFPNINKLFTESEIVINKKVLSNVRFLPFYNQNKETEIVINSLFLINQNLELIDNFEIRGKQINYKSQKITIIEEDNMFSYPCIYYDIVYFSKTLKNYGYDEVYIIDYDFTKKDSRFTNNPLYESKKENKPYIDNNAYKDYLTFELIFSSIQDMVYYYFFMIIVFSFFITILINLTRLLKDKKNIAILISRGYSNFEILLIYMTSLFLNSLIMIPLFFIIPQIKVSFCLAFFLQWITILISYSYLKKRKLHDLLKEEILT